jgi:hypothetical protein
MPAMRAKFKLVKVSKRMTTVRNPETGKWDKYAPVWDLEFTAVMGGTPENESF